MSTVRGGLLLAALAASNASNASGQDSGAVIERLKAMTEQALTPELAVEALAQYDALPVGTDSTEHYRRTLLLRKLADFVRRTPTPGLPDEVELRRRGLRRAQASKNTALIGQEWLGLGIAARHSGDFDQARSAFRESLQIKSPYVSWCLAHLHLGNIARELGDLEQARREFLAAGLAAPEGDADRARALRGASEGALGEYYLLVGHVRLARHHFLNEREILGDAHPTVRKRQLELWLFSERFAEVREVASDWAHAARDAGDTELVDTIELIDAIAQLRLGDSSGAIRRFETLRGRTGSPVAEAARLRLAAALLDADQIDRAREEFEVPSNGKSHGTRERAALLRARLAVRTSAHTASHATELKSIVDQLLGQWDRVEVPADGLGFLQLAHRRDLISMLLTLQMRDDPSGKSALSTVLNIAQRGAFARRLDLLDVDTASVLTRLGGSGVSILWVPANVGSHLFLLVNDEVRHYPIESEKVVRPLVRRFRASVLDPTADPSHIREVGQELRASLFPRDAWDLVTQHRALHLIGSDVWGRLPIEALPGSSEDHLGQSHSIDHIPSARIAAWMSQALPRLNVTTTTTSWAPTPSDEAVTRWGVEPLAIEAADVETVFHDWLSRGELQELSPLSWSRPAADYQIVLAHGVFAGKRLRPIGLAIGAPPHAVWADTIEGGAAAPLTVVLACGAGRVPQRRGEDGGSSLASALLWAGARTVVIADENLELASALAIVREMNAELSNGHTVAEALRLARVEVASREGFEAPVYHSLLKVVGNGDLRIEVARARKNPGWLWWAVGLVLAVPVALLASRRFRRRASEP